MCVYAINFFFFFFFFSQFKRPTSRLLDVMLDRRERGGIYFSVSHSQGRCWLARLLIHLWLKARNHLPPTFPLCANAVTCFLFFYLIQSSFLLHRLVFIVYPAHNEVSDIHTPILPGMVFEVFFLVTIPWSSQSCTVTNYLDSGSENYAFGLSRVV